MFTIHTRNLIKTFDGVRALDHITFEFMSGKITSVVGPNGSGKTTLINVLSGFTAWDSGSIVVGERTLRKLKPYEASHYGLSRTFQEVRLFEQLTVLDNILVVLTERNVWAALFERHGEYHLKRAQEVLTRVGLWEKRHQSARQLSYGQRKLLELARVLAMDAKVILLDEPFAGLFPEMVRHMVEVVLEFKHQGRAIVLVEHNMELVRELSDYVYVMDSGQRLAEGKPNDVLAQREVIEAYLGT